MLDLLFLLLDLLFLLLDLLLLLVLLFLQRHVHCIQLLPQIVHLTAQVVYLCTQRVHTILRLFIGALIRLILLVDLCQSLWERLLIHLVPQRDREQLIGETDTVVGIVPQKLKRCIRRVKDMRVAAYITLHVADTICHKGRFLCHVAQGFRPLAKNRKPFKISR